MKVQALWDRRYIELARFVSEWSKDPSTRTGAVIVSPNGFVVGLGYNGLPRGVEDTEERLSNRELKYKMIVHCERNALIAAQGCGLGATLYTWPFMSCAPCAAMMIQAGIKRCVAPLNDAPRWAEDFALTRQMFAEANVSLSEVVF